MYIHLFRYDHILVWVMKTFSTPASSILPSIAGIELELRQAADGALHAADQLALLGVVPLADELRRGDVVHDVERLGRGVMAGSFRCGLGPG